MSSSQRSYKNLVRSFRAFKASERLSNVDNTIWQDLQTCFLRYANTADESLLIGVLSALYKHREQVSKKSWWEFSMSAKEILEEAKRIAALEFLNEKTGLSCSSGTPAKKKRKERELEGTENEQDLSKKKKIRQVNAASNGISVDAFKLLKSNGVAKDKHTIALEDVFVAGAELAVICAFKIDLPWLLETAPAIQTARKILIIHGESPEEEKQFRSLVDAMGLGERFRFCRPKTKPYGTMHTKMILLFFPNGCRVCIHTSNMLLQDWEFKTQGAYIRDFPLVDQHETRQDDFKFHLLKYLESHDGLDRNLLSRIRSYDFTSAGVALVSSVPGSFQHEDMQLHGHTRLRDVLFEESLEEEGIQVAVCQFSSLGSISLAWMNQFKQTLFASKQRKMKRGVLQKDEDEIRFVYPTKSQVENSNEGMIAGTSIPVRKKNLEKSHILDKLCKWNGQQSGRNHAMPHIKTYVRYCSNRPQNPYWVFLGSFNLSGAAWGRLDKTGKRISILSYELGVLFTPRLACLPVHNIDPSIKYCRPLQTDQDMWSNAKKAGIIHLNACYASESNAQHQPRIQEGKIMINMPLPYSLPPLKFRKEDVPWVIEHFAAALGI